MSWGTNLNVKPGDWVTKFWGFRHQPESLAKVKRVMQRFIELEDGSKWNLWGHPYPRNSSYNSPCIEVTTQAHRDEIRARRLRGVISDWAEKRMGSASLEELATVAAAIPKEKPEEESTP